MEGPYGAACLLVPADYGFAVAGIVGAGPETAGLGLRDVEGSDVGAFDELGGDCACEDGAEGEGEREESWEVHDAGLDWKWCSRGKLFGGDIEINGTEEIR